MTQPIRRGRGRPPIAGVPGERFQIRIPPAVASTLRKLGDGSLSQGIVTLVSERTRRSK
jgi:hypothetical protein